MATECIDGRAGEPHIGGDDKGRIHAGLAGAGSVVLDTGKRYAATVDTANKITIQTGDCLIHGRHCSVTAAEQVTIESGTAGQRRNDLICQVYQRDANGIETAPLKVLKGTAVASSASAADPTAPSGNVANGDAADWFPLYRVPVDGVTVGTPVRLFDVLPTIAALRDSVSQKVTSEDTGWKSLYTGADSQFVQYRVKNGVCHLNVRVKSCGTSGLYVPTALPAEARPSTTIRFSCQALASSNSNNTARGSVETNGKVWLSNYGSDPIGGTASWPVG